MTQQTVLWIDVLDRHVVENEYVAVLDCDNVWRELEYIANHEIENGAWVGLDDNLTYTLVNCEPRKVDKHASVTIIATNDLDELLAHTSPPEPKPAKQSNYFNEDTAILLSARDKFNQCDVDTWTDAHIEKLGSVVAVACDADIVDFLIAVLAKVREQNQAVRS